MHIMKVEGLEIRFDYGFQRRTSVQSNDLDVPHRFQSKTSLLFGCGTSNLDTKSTTVWMWPIGFTVGLHHDIAVLRYKLAGFGNCIAIGQSLVGRRKCTRRIGKGI